MRLRLGGCNPPLVAMSHHFFSDQREEILEFERQEVLSKKRPVDHVLDLLRRDADEIRGIVITCMMSE